MAVLLLLAAAPRANAQQGYAFGGVEMSTDRVAIATLGASIYRGGQGWGPVAGMMGYQLRYPLAAGEPAAVRQAIWPSLGARYQGALGSAQLSVGYVALSGEGNSSGHEGPRAGVTSSLLADLFASSRQSTSAQVSYNWTDRFLWSRLRSSHALGTGALRLGVEGTAQGELDAGGGAYRALVLAPVLEVRLGSGFRAAAAAGPKFVRGAVPYEQPEWGGRAELVWVP